MIYGRAWEFLIICAEFDLNNKPIISYKFNRHKNHEFNTLKIIFLNTDLSRSLIHCYLILRKTIQYKQK